MNFSLVSHSSVPRYAEDVILFLEEIISSVTGSPCRRIISDDLNPFDFPPGILFYLGQQGSIIASSCSHYIVFLSLSILHNPRGLCGLSITGFRIIRQRRLNFERKILPHIDHILDYLPSHAVQLTSYYSPLISVTHIPIALGSDDSLKHSYQETQTLRDDQKLWDLCVVGSASKRRLILYNRLEKSGLSLSPYASANLSETMILSRITLNAHAFKHNNIELPRLLCSLKLGIPVVTEDCYNLRDIFPENLFITCSFSDIPNVARDLLLDYKRRLHMQANAISWYQSYYNQAFTSASLVIQDVQEAAIQKLRLPH